MEVDGRGTRGVLPSKIVGWSVNEFGVVVGWGWKRVCLCVMKTRGGLRRVRQRKQRSNRKGEREWKEGGRKRKEREGEVRATLVKKTGERARRETERKEGVSAKDYRVLVY